MIVANAEQNRSVLADITWEIFTANPITTTISHHQKIVLWGDLKYVLKHFVQSQLIEARTLDNDELLHLQCMLFLPLAVNHSNFEQLEIDLFGSFSNKQIDKLGIKRIKYRLLREFVRDETQIDEAQFIKVKYEYALDNVAPTELTNRLISKDFVNGDHPAVKKYGNFRTSVLI